MGDGQTPPLPVHHGIQAWLARYQGALTSLELNVMTNGSVLFWQRSKETLTQYLRIWQCLQSALLHTLLYMMMCYTMLMDCPRRAR